MCNQNSCFGGNSCCWIIIAIILLFLFCGNGCGSNCGTCLPEIDKLLIKHVFLASA